MYSERYPTPSWHQKIFIDSLHAIRLRQQKIGKKSSYMCRLGISFRKVVLVFLWKHFGRINTVCFPKSPCFSSSECFSNNSYSCNFEVNWCCCFFQCSFHSRPTCSHFCVHVTQSCREMSRDVKVLTDKYLWKVELLNSPCCHVNLRKRKSWKDWTQSGSEWCLAPTCLFMGIIFMENEITEQPTSVSSKFRVFEDFKQIFQFTMKTHG